MLLFRVAASAAHWPLIGRSLAAHRPPIGRRIGCSVRPARISRGTVRRDFAKLERRGEK
jgi:hypothetical protein